ncbi:hypothetical protein PHLCEN_2v4480 [Hermanssonia centrifuga]|uniref:ADF-H domain-containing protein n=1 Tax=Hermanssonia centrifuga TaxID=98765 RepID=A0A2R6PN69_9APHY|nr:hypothetical protein PHLCEN_2v4480 [Hermanssonia centrifuga]
MSATSGISASPELASAFSEAVASHPIPSNSSTLKLVLTSPRSAESLVPDASEPPSGSLEEDLDKLGDILEDDIPAYILVRLDNPPTEWLAVFYVPDAAKVRDKMLYASTRNMLTKSLGSAPFTDSIFATSKADLTAAAYDRHRVSLAAPKPMSAREKEMEEMRLAELGASSGGNGGGYQGSRARTSHVGTGVGLNWGSDVEDAVKSLADNQTEQVAVITIDSTTESLVLSAVSDCSAEELGSKLPASEPAYAFFSWQQSTRRHVVFIYSCPSSSPIKHRMLYSSGSSSVFQTAKSLLLSAGSQPDLLVSRKIETSDPNELNERYLQGELGHVLAKGSPDGASANANPSGASTPQPDAEKRFAKPRGPARKVRTSPAPVVIAWRLYSTLPDDVVPNKRKVWDSVDEAIKDIKSGDVLLSGGFGLCGTPDTLIGALAQRKDINTLTAISNNVGSGEKGLGKLLHTGQIDKMMASYIGGNKHFESLYLTGQISLELIPQGTLVGRLRAHAAGIPAFFTPTGASTAVEFGSIPIRYNEGGVKAGVKIPGNKKEAREFGGRRYLMEPAIVGDVAFVRAWKVDEVGNCVFRYTQNNFSATMARNAKLTIVEAENIVPIGSLSPNAIHVPGIYVDRIVKATAPKEIEFATIAIEPSSESSKGTETATPVKQIVLEQRHRIAKRAAKELKDGFHVNLGIGMPTLVPEFLEPDVKVWLQSENGILGMGPYPTKKQLDA